MIFGIRLKRHTLRLKRNHDKRLLCWDLLAMFAVVYRLVTSRALHLMEKLLTKNDNDLIEQFPICGVDFPEERIRRERQFDISVIPQQLCASEFLGNHFVGNGTKIVER